MSLMGGSRRGGSSFGGGDGAVRSNYNNKNNGGNSYDDMGGEKPTKIVLLNAPIDMQVDGVRRWCNQYGNVVDIRFITATGTKIFFVEYASFADAEKALRSINASNEFNIVCEFSRRKEGNANKGERGDRQNNDNREGRGDSNNKNERYSYRNGPSNQGDRQNNEFREGQNRQYNNDRETTFRSGSNNQNDRETTFRIGSNNQNDRHNNSRETRTDNQTFTRRDNDNRPQQRQNGEDNSKSNYSQRQNPVPVNFEPKITDNVKLTPNGQTNFLTKFNKTPTQQPPSLSPPKWNTADSANTTKITDTKSTVATKNFKEPDPRPVSNNISAVSDNTPVPSKKGSCVNCHKESKFVCERCKCFYCSHECQSEDWPFHKAVCNELPRLIPVKINYSKNFKILDPPTPPSEIKISPVKTVVGTPPGFNKTIPPPELSSSKVEHKVLIGGYKPPSNAMVDKSKVPGDSPKTQNTTAKASEIPPDHPNKEEIDKIDNFYKMQNDIDRSLANTTSGITFKVNQFAANLPQRLTSPEQPKPSQPIASPALHIFGEFPKNRSAVVITAVISPDTVYIRSSSGKENAAYCKLLQDVYSYAAGAKNLTQLPNKGDMVLADYQGTYNRALVLKAQSKQEINIAYLDFGNVDIKRLDELKSITKELQEVPRYTFRVNLKGVLKNSMPEEGLKYLNNLCDEIVELEIRYEIVDVDDKEKKCELYDPAASIIVNVRLNELMEIKPPTDDDKIVMLDDIPVRNMPPSKKVKVVIRDNSLISVGCISVATADCEFDVKALNTEVNRYCSAIKTSEPYTPRINEACLVFLHAENLWVRAVCVETVGNGNPKMQLVDIGSFVDINIKFIRRMPAKLAKVPCCAIQTYLKKLPFPLNGQQVAKAMEFFPLNELIVLDEVEVDEGNEEDGESTNVITVHKLGDYFQK